MDTCIYALYIGRGSVHEHESREGGGRGVCQLEAALALPHQVRHANPWTLNVREQQMPSPRPWKMITHFHSTVRNPN